MQSVSQAVPEDGRWLAAEGPYRDHIAAWCELNPNLKSPDSKNRWSPLQVGNARVVLLEIGHGERAKRIIKRSELSQSPVAGPPRTSMLEDLCFYLDEYGAYLTENCNPVSTITPALFMQKIVASHYMQLVEFVRANIYNLEYQLGRRNTLTEIHIPWIEERWSDLQTWSRRCSEYVEDVEAIMIGLGIPFSTPFVCDSMPPDWKRCDKDFQYIHYRLKFRKAHVVSVNNSITGLAGIAGNQQALCEAKRSLKEAKAVKTLTLLGMVFIPLAFCSGLFSMSDQYLPGKSSFWIYWATSIPLIVAIFFIAFLINLGYNIEGGWDLVTLLETLRRSRV